MAGSLPARLTPREGRKFGLTVGLAFLVLGGIVLWRDKTTVAAVLGGLGAVLVLGGLLLPTRLGPVQRGWMGLAHAISRITTPIIMSIMYFLIITPIGILRRLFGGSALVRKPNDPALMPGGFWVVREAGRRKSDLTRQY